MTKRMTFLVGVVGVLALLLVGAPPAARAQGPVTPPPPPLPTPIPLDGYQQTAVAANAQASAAGSKLAQAQAEYAQAQALAAQANARLAEAQQARDRQLLEQSVTLSTQAKDLADQSLAKVATAEKLLGDAQMQIGDLQDSSAALLADLDRTRSELNGTLAQLMAVQQYATDLRVQMIQAGQQANTLMILLAFSLIIAAVMALVLIIRTRQSQEALAVAATAVSPSPAPAPAAGNETGSVIDEQGTLLYEETDVDEELSLMLASVFAPLGPNAAASGA